jgi:hypothetical protein
MRAYDVEEPNGPFRAIELHRPTPGINQVLVRIAASGVDPLDTKIRAGKAAHAKHPLPAVLGLDMAGTVEEVGPGATAFRPGHEVYGMVGGVGGLQGTLAEFIAADADLVARKPANLTMREAAALPLSIITAWEGLVDCLTGRCFNQLKLPKGSQTGIPISLRAERTFQKLCWHSSRRMAAILRVTEFRRFQLMQNRQCAQGHLIDGPTDELPCLGCQTGGQLGLHTLCLYKPSPIS